MERINLSPLEIDPSCPLRREMPRRADLRQPGYEDEFDFLTVFYDSLRRLREFGIRDWVHFFARKDGADAVLFYDNASTKYEISEIHETNLIHRWHRGCLVVPWPLQIRPSVQSTTRKESTARRESLGFQLLQLRHPRACATQISQPSGSGRKCRCGRTDTTNWTSISAGNDRIDDAVVTCAMETSAPPAAP
jgi:hypothetical protein